MHLPDGLDFSSSTHLDDSGDPVVRWTIRATDETGTAGVADAATSLFAHPSIGVDLPVFDPGSGPAVGGCAFTQFGLPVWSGPDLSLDFNPAPNLHSPPAMQPVWLRVAPEDWILAAPASRWHDQIVSVTGDDADRRLRWGPHGDLRVVDVGWTIDLDIRRGPTLRGLLARWGKAIRSAAGTSTLDRHVDVATTHLSYWTDNGAAYWYRNEAGKDLATTVVDVVDDLDRRGVPIRAVELDSWFYDHEIPRPVRPDDYPEAVPPTGLLRWDARADTVPDGMPAFAEALGHRPLILHSRHLSTGADGIDDTWWIDLCAHPSDPEWFRTWFERARDWGATTIEQDWMLLYWFGVRQLRETSGRAANWLDTLDRLAEEHDLHLWFCMATPPDLIHAATLDRVSAVRTSDDYRFAEDPASLWRWFLTVNLLADGLGLPPFKDCFFSSGVDDLDTPGPTDGDPHHELEALLSALSAGPVGIGDRIGRTDEAVVSRICRADGLIVRPDRPLVMLARSMDPGVDVTWAATTAGANVHVVAIHTGGGETAGDTLGSDELLAEVERADAASGWLVFDPETGAAEVLDGPVTVTLGRRRWAHRVLCPIVDGAALIGDPDRHTTLGHGRYDHTVGHPILTGAAGELVREARWTLDGGLVVSTLRIGDG